MDPLIAKAIHSLQRAAFDVRLIGREIYSPDEVGAVIAEFHNVTMAIESLHKTLDSYLEEVNRS